MIIVTRFTNLEEIYKIHSNHEIKDDWYLIKDDYFQIELLQYENAKKVDFYTLRVGVRRRKKFSIF